MTRVNRKETRKMQACGWCDTKETRRWEKAANDKKVTICHACSRTKRNGYLACAMCRSRRLCMVVGNTYMCSLCAKIDFIHSETIPISCVKCETTKSMSWHTIPSGENMCLYCYDEDENVLPTVPRKKKSKHTHQTHYRFRDDVEMAALMLCHMIVTAQ